MQSLLLDNELLAKHTSYGVGGPARLVARVKAVSELPFIVAHASERGLSLYFLGGGSNTLALDEGFSGAVIKMEDRSVTIGDNRIHVAAGAVTANVAHMAAQVGLSGLEWSYGIPGTIGGAIRGNAGAFGRSMADVLESVDVFNPETREVLRMTPDQFQFRYRWSVLADIRRIVLGATFRLQVSSADACKVQMSEYLAKKNRSQPLGARCAGSVFKNIVTQSVPPRLIPQECMGSEKIYAGWLIEHAGLKGHKSGGALFSFKHANFILNEGGATSHDICALINLAKQRVKERFGLDLEEEIRYLGDSKVSY